MNKNRHTYLWYSTLGLAVGLLSFYLYLSFFSVPAVDDYTFAYVVKEKGLLAAQEYWYTSWTGRYSSSFLISLNPLLWQSLVLYGLYSFLLICLTFFSLHYFIRSIFQASRFKLGYILLALICTLLFLDKMPNLTDGFYWMPGAFTYQLANILLAFLLGLLIRINRSSSSASTNRKYVWALLVVLLVCGTNEVAMLLSVFFTGLNFIIRSLQHSRLKKLDLLLAAATILFASVMYFAPGNEGRSSNFSELSSAKNIGLALDASFNEIHYRISKWSFHPFILTVITGVSLGLINKTRNVFKKPNSLILLVLGMLICGYLVVLLSVFPAFYVEHDVIQTRTLNVTFWVFLLFSIGLAYLLSLFVQTDTIKGFRWQKGLMPFLCLLALVFLIFSNGNQINAISDVIYGSAFDYRSQYKKRNSLMRACESDVCTLPAFNSFPHTVYHSDLLVDKGDWWTSSFKSFYKKDKIIIDDSALKPFYTASYGFENDKKLAPLTAVPPLHADYAYSGNQSTLIAESNLYSIKYSLIFDTLPSPPGEKAAYIKVRCMARVEKPDAIFKLVAAIQDPAFQKQTSWQCTIVEKKGLAQNSTWQEVNLLIDLTSQSIKPEYELSIYFWNPEKQVTYIDDLSITIY
ncbi:MAG: hypothetical protein GVX78_03940 [Bacteroidetes bacterium]|jgi:hypothetical protein|nr:hypothetical protein [Bacteroidota bacterium]